MAQEFIRDPGPNSRSPRVFRSPFVVRKGTAIMKPRSSLPHVASFLWCVGAVLGFITSSLCSRCLAALQISSFLSLLAFLGNLHLLKLSPSFQVLSPFHSLSFSFDSFPPDFLLDLLDEIQARSRPRFFFYRW